MKNILITSGIFIPEIGGPATYAQTLGTRLARNIPVTILTYSDVFRFEGDKQFPFKVVRVWKMLPKGIRHIWYFIKLLRYAPKHDLILTLNAVSAGVPAVWASRLFKKPLWVRIVGDYAWEQAIQKKRTLLLINDFQKVPRTGIAGLHHRLQTWVCQRAKGIIVPSHYLSALVQGWGISGEKIHVVPNGIEPVISDMSKEDARKTIGIAGNILLSVGRMVPWKGFRMLVKIMPQLLHVNQFFRLIIVGDGPEMDVLKSMVKNLGLDRKVYLVGKKTKKELETYLAAADIFVLNTGYEGFSHQIVETMAAGVPVITTAVGGNFEIVSQGENGFLVKYNDEFNLIEAIKSLWNMPELREEFAVEGRKTAAKFTVQEMLNNTVKLFIS